MFDLSIFGKIKFSTQLHLFLILGHQKVHGLENTITCGDCGVVLKDNKALSRHQKKDHEEN